MTFKLNVRVSLHPGALSQYLVVLSAVLLTPVFNYQLSTCWWTALPE